MQLNPGANGSSPRTVPHSPAFPGCMTMEALVFKEGSDPAAREQGAIVCVRLARLHVLSLKVVAANAASDLTESCCTNVGTASSSGSTLERRPGTGHTKSLLQPTACSAGCSSVRMRGATGSMLALSHAHWAPNGIANRSPHRPCPGRILTAAPRTPHINKFCGLLAINVPGKLHRHEPGLAMPRSPLGGQAASSWLAGCLRSGCWRATRSAPISRGRRDVKLA